MQGIPRSRGVLAGALIVVAACGGGKSAAVVSVQLQSTNTNPHVGETSHVGASPVDAGGVAVQGVGCAFVSSNPGVASVDTANGTVTALSPGVTTITATCGGKAASVDITVRPNDVKLTITKQGNAGGPASATPPGTPNYLP